VAGKQGIDGAFRHILDAISDGVCVTGAERITGHAPDEVAGHRCDEEILVHTDLTGAGLCLSGCPLQDCIDTGEAHSLNEVFLKRKDGERVAVYVKASGDGSGR
jgi:PAS domain-containing protein